MDYELAWWKYLGIGDARRGGEGKKNVEETTERSEAVFEMQTSRTLIRSRVLLFSRPAKIEAAQELGWKITCCCRTEGGNGGYPA
jgi:hypothetical protein